MNCGKECDYDRYETCIYINYFKRKIENEETNG